MSGEWAGGLVDPCVRLYQTGQRVAAFAWCLHAVDAPLHAHSMDACRTAA